MPHTVAEDAFERALRRAQDLPHLIEQPEARRWFAWMLLRRAEAGDPARARQLLDEADKNQSARTRALEGFKSGGTPVLVATDIASRGIDVDDISHVVNFDMPNVPETYIHRIGRTARAGASGIAVSFCDHDELDDLRAIERLIRTQLELMEDTPDLTFGAPPTHRERNGHQSRRKSTSGNPRRRSGRSRARRSRQSARYAPSRRS